MTREVIDIAEKIAHHFPIGGSRYSLEIYTGATGKWFSGDEPIAVATIRGIVWDSDAESGERLIRDLKEQEVNMGWPVFYDNQARVEEFFAALQVVVNEIDDGVLCGLMPADLVLVSPLKLRRAETRKDFEAALRAKSRLGAYLAS